MKYIVSIAVFLAIFTAFSGPIVTSAAFESHSSAFSSRLIASKADIILKVPPGETVSIPTCELKTCIFPNVVRMALRLVGTVVFIVFIYAGIMLIIAQGNDEQITKFKNILIWSGVGTAFIAASYAIVTGIMRLVLT